MELDFSDRLVCQSSPSDFYQGWKVRRSTIQILLRLVIIIGRKSYFFSIVGSSVKIHSVVTGQVVSTLVAPSPPGNEAVSDLITSAILNPHNAFQLITGSLNGCIMVWDFLDAALLKTIDIAQPIHYLCAHEKFKDYVFAAATRPSKEKSGARRLFYISRIRFLISSVCD